MGEILKSKEVQRLLSEYAAGIISDEDRRRLLGAALEDQRLFEALARAQPLAELMADSASRAELRAALQGRARMRLPVWLWRPWPMTAAATAMVAILVVLVTQYMPQSPLAPESRPAAGKVEIQAAAKAAAERAAVADMPIGGIIGAPPGGINSGQLGSKPAALALAPSTTSPVMSLQASGGGAAGGIGIGTALSDEERALRAKRAAAPVLAPPPVVGGVVGGVVRGVVGGVPGGVIGGLIGSGEEKKGAVNPPTAETPAAEASKIKQETRLAEAAPHLRCQLLLRSAAGQFQEVPPDTRFGPGDVVRLQLQPQSSGYLALAEMDEEGRWKLIFPPEGSVAAPVEAGGRIMLPGDQSWEFGPKPRERRLLAVFSKEPQPALIGPDGTLLRPESGELIDILLRVTP